ncbi:hypothetical protein MMC14_003524 [Varicellaria rhodocarpa]|nr:hypothetical protein [Varicellaria rhodocarpa]
MASFTPAVVYVMWVADTAGGQTVEFIEDAFESLEDANHAVWYYYHDWIREDMDGYMEEMHEDGTLSILVEYAEEEMVSTAYLTRLEVTPSSRRIVEAAT